MKKYDSITVIKIMVNASSGAHLTNCIKDAVHLAVENWMNVELEHNGRTYRINVNDILTLAEKVKED